MGVAAEGEFAALIFGNGQHPQHSRVVAMGVDLQPNPKIGGFFEEAGKGLVGNQPEEGFGMLPVAHRLEGVGDGNRGGLQDLVQFRMIHKRIEAFYQKISQIGGPILKGALQEGAQKGFPQRGNPAFGLLLGHPVDLHQLCLQPKAGFGVGGGILHNKIDHMDMGVRNQQKIQFLGALGAHAQGLAHSAVFRFGSH